jgi:hypothetical protein
MAKARNVGDKLKSIDDQIAQLKARKQAMKAREKNKERAERTRRLIQNGALAEQYLQCKDMPTAQFELFLSSLVNREDFADLIFQAQQESLSQIEQVQDEKTQTQSTEGEYDPTLNQTGEEKPD